MTKAIVLSDYGPPEVLVAGEVEAGPPGAGQVRVNVEYAGVGPTDLAGGPARVVTLSDPRAVGFGVRLSGPDGPRIAARLQSVMAALATGRLRLRGQVVAPLEDAARVHRHLESGRLRAKVLLAVQS